MKCDLQQAKDIIEDIKNIPTNPNVKICPECQNKSINDFMNDTSCYLCGGYRYISVRNKCSTCEETGWFTPGVLTVYKGKTINSKDGKVFIWHKDGMLCEKCSKERDK